MSRENIKFDFREGIDIDKIVYKNTRTRWEHAIYYFLCMLFTWLYAFGFLWLNFYLYANYEDVVKWIFIGVWVAVVLSIIIRGGIILAGYYSRKWDKERKKKEEENRMKEELKRKAEESKRLQQERNGKIIGSDNREVNVNQI
jgi:hypothetical protein